MMGDQEVTQGEVYEAAVSREYPYASMSGMIRGILPATTRKISEATFTA